MRGKAVHLAAAIAESFRFVALAFLAFSVGALYDSSASSLLRYASAPQLLFAAGFFFMWLDPGRYGSYRPLLLVGKAASLVCLAPLAASVAADPSAQGEAFGLRAAGLVLAFAVVAIDVGGLAVLALAGSGGGAPGGDRPATPTGPRLPGQGPDDIEGIEA
jgi:hypothetical protein